ncbi:hypothetical protein BS17DRAFT_517216 [Gyrodon lividus]|nr:hypothetical protein BS17DRAFT_517216 [Gyrodon lividus]
MHMTRLGSFCLTTLSLACAQQKLGLRLQLTCIFVPGNIVEPSPRWRWRRYELQASKEAVRSRGTSIIAGWFSTHDHVMLDSGSVIRPVSKSSKSIGRKRIPGLAWPSQINICL